MTIPSRTYKAIMNDMQLVYTFRPLFREIPHQPALVGTMVLLPIVSLVAMILAVLVPGYSAYTYISIPILLSLKPFGIKALLPFLNRGNRCRADPCCCRGTIPGTVQSRERLPLGSRKSATIA